MKRKSLRKLGKGSETEETLAGGYFSLKSDAQRAKKVENPHQKTLKVGGVVEKRASQADRYIKFPSRRGLEAAPFKRKASEKSQFASRDRLKEKREKENTSGSHGTRNVYRILGRRVKKRALSLQSPGRTRFYGEKRTRSQGRGSAKTWEKGAAASLSR